MFNRLRENMNQQWKYKSKFGNLFLVASSEGLRGIYWNKQDAEMIKSLSESKILNSAVKELDLYFLGKMKVFKTQFDLEGTSFQNKVWNELLKIPFGETCSYQDIAFRIHHPKAVRAVGSANGKNPICIMIPCHRVISKNGSLGGYSGGLAFKKKLLALEGASPT